MTAPMNGERPMVRETARHASSDSPGSYFHALAEAEHAGTAWTCRCGTRNPGTWDTCQECQQAGNAQ